MRSTHKCFVLAIAGVLSAGCVVRSYEPYPPPRAVVVAEPPYYGPGVEVIDVEPAPADRVYIYDPGYPPGVYFCDGFYWYGGYRYERDVFINRVVVVNVREHRYVNVEENRRYGARVELRQRQEFAARHDPRGARPARASARIRADER